LRTTQPRKQRKLLYQAPSHVRHKSLSAPLSPSLKASHKVNSIPVRRGDTVRVIRGDRKGTEGKVTRVDQKTYRIFIEGITREKVDGTATPIPIHPSKVMITGLNLDDKWRKESLKAEAVAEKVEKPEEKPVEEEEKPEEKKPEAPEKVLKRKKPRASSARKTKKVKAEKTEGSESG
jgi:large subunit ribosomal protein L24